MRNEGPEKLSREELLRVYSQSVTTGEGSWQDKKNQREAEKEARKLRGKIEEHLDPDQTEAYDRKNARNSEHPTKGNTSEIPDRWSTVGQLKKPGG